MKTLAIFSPGINTDSETFITAHKKLPFNIKFYYDGYLPKKLEGHKSLIDFSIKQKVKKQFKKNFVLFEFALAESLRNEKVDCILAEYGPSGAESLEVIKYLKLPLIVHFHGYDASEENVLTKYGSKYRELFKYANAIIVVSNKMREALLDLGCLPQKLRVTPCGPNSEFFKIKPAYQNRQFVAVGRFVEKKAPHLTIEAFKKVTEKFPEAKLIMVGDGELLTTCKKIAISHCIEKNIDFKGVLTSSKIGSLFSQSIAFVQHSIVAENGDIEGTPVAILEAQAAALPVISTFHAGIADVVINNETGLLVKEHDVSGMAENMIRILDEPGLARKLGESGRKRVKENFTMEKHLEILQMEIEKAMVN